MEIGSMDFLEGAKDITSEFTFASDITFNTGMSKVYKCGNLIMGSLRFTTPSTTSNNKTVVTIPAKYKNIEANSSYTLYLGPICEAFGAAQVKGNLIITPNPNVIAIAGSSWATSSQVVARFMYFIA